MMYAETVLLNITYEHGLHISSDWFDIWIEYPMMLVIGAGLVGLRLWRLFYKGAK